MRSSILLLLVLASPLSAFESPEALQMAFEAAMRNNDAEGLAACYTEDAVNFPPDAMIGHGPDSARQSWGAFFEQNTVLSLELSEKQMVKSGDLAVAWGLFHLRFQPKAGGEPVDMMGRYMDAARPVDGRWLYIADHASIPMVVPE